MPKKFIWGVGLRKYEGYKLELASPPEDYVAIAEEVIESFDSEGIRNARASEFIERLRKAGIKYAGWECGSSEEWGRWCLSIHELGEDSFEQLAVLWLLEFHRLENTRSLLGLVELDRRSIVIDLIRHAEELGRIEERIFWRTKPVPGTASATSPAGKSPEDLALERLPQREALVRRNQGRDQLNAKRKVQAERWRDRALALASEYWERHPAASKLEVAAHIHKELAKLRRAEAGASEKEQPKLPSANTIRRFIAKPVRA